MAKTKNPAHPPTDRTFPLFGLLSNHRLPGQHRLTYFGDARLIFPIGNIGDKSEGAVSADNARKVVEGVFGTMYDPIIHLALGPHDGSLGFGHNNVVVLDELPNQHTTVIADAVIFPKPSEGSGAVAIETLLGDCAVVCFASNDHLGFMHVGRASSKRSCINGPQQLKRPEPTSDPRFVASTTGSRRWTRSTANASASRAPSLANSAFLSRGSSSQRSSTRTSYWDAKP